MPLIKATGTNIAAITTVVEITAKTTKSAPLLAALKGSSPFSLCRKMLSRTTIASSITTPTARLKARSVMLLSVNPRKYIKVKVTRNEVGMDRKIMKVLKKLRRKNSTTRPVINIARMMAYWTSPMDATIKSPRSTAISIVMPSGSCFCTSSKTFLTSFDTDTVFAPDCFLTPRPTAGSMMPGE